MTDFGVFAAIAITNTQPATNERPAEWTEEQKLKQPELLESASPEISSEDNQLLTKIED